MIIYFNIWYLKLDVYQNLLIGCCRLNIYKIIYNSTHIFIIFFKWDRGHAYHLLLEHSTIFFYFLIILNKSIFIKKNSIKLCQWYNKCHNYVVK